MEVSIIVLNKQEKLITQKLGWRFEFRSQCNRVHITVVLPPGGQVRLAEAASFVAAWRKYKQRRRQGAVHTLTIIRTPKHNLTQLQ